MAWEENSRICLHMLLIAILSRIGVITQKYIPLEDPRSYFLCLTNLYLWSEEHNCISKTYQQENMGQAKPERKWLYKKESDLSERKKKGAIHEDSSFYIYIIFFASIT